MLKSYKISFLVLLAVYVALVFGLPPDPKVLQRYDFSMAEAKLINLTIILPLTAIYLMALYGFMRMYSYALKVRRSKEGPGLLDLAKGLTILAFSLAIGSVVGALSSFISYRYPQWATEVIVLRHYVSLTLAFAAFFFIARGIQKLLNTLNKKLEPVFPTYSLLAPITLASIFTWLIARERPSAEINTYHLPDWLIILTLVIPYTYIWSLGIRAALQLYKYKNTVRGTLYRHALSDVSKGVGALIVISVLVQLLTTVSEQLNRLSLTPLLLIIYVLVILYAVGYGLVARGAKSLKKIEEV